MFRYFVVCKSHRQFNGQSSICRAVVLNPDGSPLTLGGIALATQTFASRTQAYDVTNENQAVFAELTYAISDRLDLTLGARYTEDNREFTRIPDVVRRRI